MKTIQFIREELGISQLTMAQYLSIPLSQLAMHEIGKRDLPATAVIKIAEILLFLNQEQKNTEAENTITDAQNLKVKEFLALQKKELEYKQIKEQRKLDAILKKHQQSIKLNALASLLLKKESAQANILLLQAKKTIEKNSIAIQVKQLLKLESIKSQLAYIKNLTDYK